MQARAAADRTALLRTLVQYTMSALLVTVDHIARKGDVVDLLTLVVLLPLLIAIPARGGPRPSFARTAVSLGAAQVALHVLIDVAHAHSLGGGVTANWVSGLSVVCAQAAATLLVAVLLRDAACLIDVVVDVVRRVVVRRRACPQLPTVVVLPLVATSWSPRLDPVRAASGTRRGPPLL